MSQRAAGRMRGAAVNQRNFQDSSNKGQLMRVPNQQVNNNRQGMGPNTDQNYNRSANAPYGQQAAQMRQNLQMPSRFNNQGTNGLGQANNPQYNHMSAQPKDMRHRLKNQQNQMNMMSNFNRDPNGIDVQDSYMNENFEDSYDQYANYKDKPKGDSFYQNIGNVPNPMQYRTQQINQHPNNPNSSVEMEFSDALQKNDSLKSKVHPGSNANFPIKMQAYQLQKNASIQGAFNSNRPGAIKQDQILKSKQTNTQTYGRNSDQLQKPTHYKSFKSEERDKSNRASKGRKNYLKDTNNRNVVMSPKSDLSGGGMSNFSSQSELKYHVNTSIKMKTPNQTAGNQKYQQHERSSINDSSHRYESHTQQSVALSPSMNNRTSVGGKTPQDRQPSHITLTSGNFTPAGYQNHYVNRKNLKSMGSSQNFNQPGMAKQQKPNNLYEARDSSSYNNDMMFPRQSQTNQSNSNQAPMLNSSQLNNSSKNESLGINGSIKLQNEGYRGSIDDYQDRERGSWKFGEIAAQNTMGPKSVYNLKGRKTEDFGLDSHNIKASGIVSTPKIQQTQKMSRNMRQQNRIRDNSSDDPKLIFDSDQEIGSARMDDTDEYKPPPKKLKSKPKTQSQMNRKNGQADDEDDCEVPDEDIGINSLSCERQTVNSQGVLSMKDFQSLSKRNIFQRKINQSIKSTRTGPNQNRDSIMPNQQNYQAFSPGRTNLLKVPNGPVMGQPMGYAQKRIQKQKQQRESFFNKNQALLDQRNDIGSQDGLSASDLKDNISFIKLISNSSSKPGTTAFTRNTQEQFSTTQDLRKNDKNFMKIIHDNQEKSRQNSISHINSNPSQMSRQSKSQSQFEERIINQNVQNISPTKIQPGFTNQNPNYRRFEADKQSQMDKKSVSIEPFSDKAMSKDGRREDANSVSKSGRSRMEKSTGQQPHQKMQSPVQNIRQSNSQINTAVQVRGKTKAGIVSPQGIVSEMQCTCPQIERNRESYPNSSSRLASSRLGVHSRQKSRVSNPVPVVDQNPPEITTQTDDDYNVSLTQSISEIDKMDSARARICGKFCKNLSAEQERNIILQCLKDSITQHIENLQGKSLEELKSSMVSELEQSKYTAKHFQSLNMINAQENDKRYLISASWWREWCDYTDFNISQLQLKTTSQILHNSFAKLQISGAIDRSNIGNSPHNQLSNQTRQETSIMNPSLQINFRNQQMQLHMESSQIKNKDQDLQSIREFTHESTIQQIQLSTQVDKEMNAPKQVGRNKIESMQMRNSPQGSLRLPQGKKNKMISNNLIKKSSMVQNYMTVDASSLEHPNKNKQIRSNKQTREVSFRKTSSIVESESQYSVKDSIRQRQADFNKELQLLKIQNRNRDSNKNDKQNPYDNEYDQAAEQDSIAINTESFRDSDRRHREQMNKYFDDVKDESLQSGVFMKKNIGCYKKPQVIQNAELLKDPNVVKDMQEQNMGNMSPNSQTGGIMAGRKPVGTGNSQQNMNYMYMILKDDLIEHFDYEAVNMQIFQLFRAWYGVDIQIMRFIKSDNVNRVELFLDLYPEKRLANHHYQQSSSGQKQRQSRYQVKPQNINREGAETDNQGMMSLNVPQTNQQQFQKSKGINEGHRYFRKRD